MRIDVIDIMKGIAIIMIVNVHLLSGPFFSVGETFHVITFFFTAGIVHGVSEKWQSLSIRSFFARRASRLIYPFFALSACYICFHVFLNLVRGDEIINGVIRDSLISTLTLKGIGTLWFLPVFFLGEVLFYIFKKYNSPDWALLCFGGAAVFLSSYLNSKGVCGIHWYGDSSPYGILINNPLTLLLASVIASMFVDFGYVVYKANPRFFSGRIDSSKFYLWVAIICIVSLLIDFSCVRQYQGDLHKLNIGNPFYYLVCSFFGILFVGTFSLLLERYCRIALSFLRYFGKNSLVIMTTHTEYYINSIAYLAVTSLFSALSISTTDKMVSGISLLIILLIEFVIVFIVNHSFLRHLYVLPKRK